MKDRGRPLRSLSLGSSGGFTLIELIINVAILGVLAAIAVPAYVNFRDRAVTARAQYDLRIIAGAIERLVTDTEQWPGHQTVGKTNTAASNEIWDLNALNAGLVATDGNFPNWRGPYLNSVPTDPWGSKYFFDTDYFTGPGMTGTLKAAVGSFGPDKCCPLSYDSNNIVIYFTQ